MLIRWRYFTGRKKLLEKATTIKRFGYSSLGSELKKKIRIVRKQYWGLNKVYEFDKKEVNDETTNRKKIMIKQQQLKNIKKSNKSNLVCDSKIGFATTIVLKCLITFC